MVEKACEQCNLNKLDDQLVVKLKIFDEFNYSLWRHHANKVSSILGLAAAFLILKNKPLHAHPMKIMAVLLIFDSVASI
jgi:hypothetical protein